MVGSYRTRAWLFKNLMTVFFKWYLNDENRPLKHLCGLLGFAKTWLTAVPAQPRTLLHVPLRGKFEKAKFLQAHSVPLVDRGGHLYSESITTTRTRRKDFLASLLCGVDSVESFMCYFFAGKQQMYDLGLRYRRDYIEERQLVRPIFSAQQISYVNPKRRIVAAFHQFTAHSRSNTLFEIAASNGSTVKISIFFDFVPVHIKRKIKAEKQYRSFFYFWTSNIFWWFFCGCSCICKKYS